MILRTLMFCAVLAPTLVHAEEQIQGFDFAAPPAYDVDSNPPEVEVGSILLDTKDSSFKALDSSGNWQNLSVASKPASAAQSGYVTTTAQTFAGVKTFQDGVSAPTSGTAGNVFSGSYTTTTSNPTGVVGTVTGATSYYTRVGNVVTLGGKVSFTSTSGGFTFQISLPSFFTNNFSSADQCFGRFGAAGNALLGRIESAASSTNFKVDGFTTASFSAEDTRYTVTCVIP